MAFFGDLICAIFFIVSAPWWIYKMVRSKKYRAGWPQRFGWVPKREGDRRCIWIHGVSVGEILAARALVRMIGEEHPDWDVVLSTTTLDGQTVAKRVYPGRIVFYFPMEFSAMIRRTLHRIRPAAVLLIELEIWANFLHHTRRAGIPVILVNGRISRRSYHLYRFVRWALFRPFRKIRWYCVQSREYADRFAALGIPRSQIEVTGSMKFDNISIGEGREEARKEARRRLSIADGDWVIIAGSTHAGEEQALLEVCREVQRRRPESRLVLVPRHMERIPQVESLLRERGDAYVKKTALDGSAPSGREIILVDTMGDLQQIYPAANVVFVGGSLVPIGGHNMLEPAGLGLAVIIGPHVFKCADDVNLLVKAEAGLQVADAQELRSTILSLLENPDKIRALEDKAADTLLAHQGATEKNLRYLEKVLEATGGADKPKAETPQPRRGDAA